MRIRIVAAPVVVSILVALAGLSPMLPVYAPWSCTRVLGPTLAANSYTINIHYHAAGVLLSATAYIVYTSPTASVGIGDEFNPSTGKHVVVFQNPNSFSVYVE